MRWNGLPAIFRKKKAVFTVDVERDDIKGRRGPFTWKRRGGLHTEMLLLTGRGKGEHLKGRRPL